MTSAHDFTSASASPVEDLSDWGQVDTASLVWLLPELRGALDAALAALRQFGAGAQAGDVDLTPLRVARSHLHQAHGALQVVDLEGVSLLTEEIEHLLETFEADPARCDGEALAAIAGACRSVVEYLDELLTGARHQPVRLYPSYRGLLHLRGANRIHPADLFFPDLSMRPPRPASPGHVLSSGEMAEQRSRFELALLRFLRNDRDLTSAAAMSRAVSAIEASVSRTSRQGQQRAYWWVTRALFEALAADAFRGARAQDLNLKRLAARINLQIRLLLEGSGTIAERLLRDTLFFVACADPATPHVRAVKALYRLEEALPDDFETERYGKIDADALRAAREIIAHAKTAWSAVAAGEGAQIAAFAVEAGALLQAVGQLGRPGLAQVAQVIAGIGTELSFDPRKPSEAVGLDVATALLFLDGALEQFRSLDESFDERARAVVERVEASALGQSAPSGAMPWLDKISREADERLTMARFVSEMQVNLRAAEKALDAFFRDPAQRDDLPTAQKSLAQIGGALGMLGHQDAQRAVEDGRAAIRTFAEETYVPVPGEFERIAQNLGAVGFFIDQLLQRSDNSAAFYFDPESRVFTADIARAPVEPPAPDSEDDDRGPALESQAGGSPHDETAANAKYAPDTHEPETTLEQQIARRGEDAAHLAESLRADPGDEVARDLLITTLESVRHDAVLIDDSELHDQAATALRLIEDSAAAGELFSSGTTSGLFESIATLVSRADRAAGLEPNALAPVAPSVPVRLDDDVAAFDAELLEIFLEEAEEVLANGREALTVLEQQPADAEALATLRRGFHTLKGSGRMVGLTALGEAAWSIEQTLNPYIAESRSPNPEVCALLDYAIRYVTAWVGELRASATSQRTPDALIEAAKAVRDDEEERSSAAPGIYPPSGDALVREESGDIHTATLIDELFSSAGGDAERSAADEAQFAATQFSSDHDRETGELYFFGEQPALPMLDQAAPARRAGTMPDYPVEAKAETDAEHFDLAFPEVPQSAYGLDEPQETGSVGEPRTGSTEHDAEWTESAPDSATEHVLDVPPIEASSPDHDETLHLDALADAPAPSVAQPSAEAIVARATIVESALPAPEPAYEASAIIEPQASVTTLALAEPEALPRRDEFRTIGPLTLSVPLFNIYLSEADELLRILTQDFGEWRHELGRTVSESAIRAAHSLAGSSATVGLTSAHELAAALESVISSLLLAPAALHDDDLEVLEEAVEDLRTMLHRFAAERLPDGKPQLIAKLDGLRDTLSQRHRVERYAHDLPHEAHVASARDGQDVDSAMSETVAKDEELPAAPVVEHQDAAEKDDAQTVAFDARVDDVAAPPPEVASVTETVDDRADSVARSAVTVERGFAVRETPHVAPGSRSVRAAGVRDEVDPELIEIFIQEAHEILPQIGANLRLWQSEPGNTRPAPILLRQLHTIKGSARMAGAMRLGEVVHDMEARVESAARLHAIPAALFEELLAAHDRGLELFDRLQHPDAASAAEHASLASHGPGVRRDDGVRDGTDAAAHAYDPADVDDILGAIQSDVEKRADEAAEDELAGLSGAHTAGRDMQPLGVRKMRPASVLAQQAVRVRSDVLDRLVNQAGEVSISRARVENEVGQIKTSLAELTENLARLRGQLREIEMQAEFQLRSQMQSQAASGFEKEKFDPLEFDRFTRFQELTRMMAESVNDVATVQQNLLKSLDNAEGDLTAQRRLTRDLQQDLMRVRMVPFSSVAERLYRVARQTAKELDKRVNLDIRGGAVEIDRSVLERMIAPFEHLLRNHIVHGIESRAARRAAGKEETGELLVEVRQEGNEIVLSFSDDGAGLDLALIREKGVAAGLIGHDEDVSASRAADLIFHHGLSTATEVTELAGRGVGLDVVRAETGVLAGRVAVDTTPGQGTRFTINLPLTLAVTQVVLVSVGGRVYALPSVLVEQVQQLRTHALAEAYNAGHLTWLGQPVKLHFLATLLGLEAGAPVAQRYSPVLILRSAGERVAVHVDEIVGNQEVVVKNLGPQLARMTGIAGATVLGSGEIALIMNPVQLAQIAARERLSLLHVPATPEIGGAVPEPVDGADARADATRVGTVSGLETLPTVMVVDDSLTVRRVTQRLLAREGYQVVLAKDGIDALQQLQEFAPDAMLVDIEMPRMDGFDLTRNLRSDERYRHIPIIMITSRTAEKHRQHAIDLGVDDYLGKPYQEDELLALLARHVEARRRVAV